MDTTIEQAATAICHASTEARWVALDNNLNIISEGESPKAVDMDAQTKSDNYSLMFLPAPGNTYIF